MQVLFLCSEVAPFSKTGGLADVAAALPAALARRGHAVVSISPLYGTIDRARHRIAPLGRAVEVTLGAETARGEIYEAPPDEGVRRLFVANAPLFDRPEIYGAYEDNWLRFAFYGRAALAACGAVGFRPEVVHGNDWQTGPAIWEASAGRLAATVFTIHNLAYQGNFPLAVGGALGWPASLLQPEALEFYGQVSFLKAGLRFADALTTVSPTYAREITTPALGAGMDGLLAARRDVLTGILNGIDGRVWDPRGDPHLPAHYGPESLDGKARCKSELQRELGLPPQPDRPLFVMVSRLSEQKGFGILLPLLTDPLLAQAQVAVLGDGDSHIQTALAAAAARKPDALALRNGFHDGLAHRLEAGGDFFLMPSLYEPCGLNQMYSMRYGTPPVARTTGGLADTVFDAAGPDGTGFLFSEAEPRALSAALIRALAAYADPSALVRLRQNGMRRDFSWDRSAALYEEVYRRALSA
jgi:starch synthase